MATLPEIAEWVAGVYQIEETDPVLGGPPNESTGAGMTNIPALQLAKRTAFLKQVLDDAGIGAAVAPSIADFNAVNKSGLYQAASAANAPEPGVPFTLLHIQSSAAQATQFASRITSDRVWFRRFAASAWSTWRELIHSGNIDGFIGTGTTAPQFDNDTSLATTAFVQRALGNQQAMEVLTGDRTLTAADAGKVFFANVSCTITLPDSTTLASGVKFTIVNAGSVNVTLAGPSAISAAGKTVTVLSGFSCDLYPRTDTNQYRIAHTGDGAASLASAGYQVLPSGLIMQWATVSGVLTSGTTYTLPIAFPTAFLGLAVAAGNNVGMQGAPVGLSQVFLSSQTGTIAGRYIAIGH